jgi:hypothetical protein
MSNSSSYAEDTKQWIPTEFNDVNIGDARLNQRLISIAESFCLSPSTSIPDKSGSWAKTKATYRFLNNNKVSHENILAPHQHATAKRVSQEQTVLAIQDTTTLNYTSHPETQGLGNIGTDPASKGILVHTTLTLTPNRIPLGLVHQQTWVRPPEEYGKKHDRHNKALQDKESQKWLNSLWATEQLQKDAPGTLIINTGDREADIFGLFQEHRDNRMRCQLLVRAMHDRNLTNPEEHLWSYLERQPVACRLEVTVPRKKQKAQRTAQVELHWAEVTLKPPIDKSDAGSITLRAIYLNEPNPPSGEEALSWMLLTTLAIQSEEDAVQYVEYYALRYTIELFHKVLKSGCGIEEHQFESVEALMGCLAIDSIVAWRIMFLTMLGRALPDLPCNIIFQDDEWKSLYCFLHHTSEPPEQAPSLGEAIRMIAKLGGFLGRKRDGQPGVEVLWRGMEKLSIIVESWKSFRPACPARFPLCGTGGTGTVGKCGG